MPSPRKEVFVTMDVTLHEDVPYYSTATKGVSRAQSQGEYLPISYPVLPLSNKCQDVRIDLSRIGLMGKQLTTLMLGQMYKL